jgi:hypothetical protein
MTVEIRFSKVFLKELKNKFGTLESIKIAEKLEQSLRENPKKGKNISSIGGILIKELKHQSFRFYFICENFKIKLLMKGELIDLILKFVRMSKKNDQQRVIHEIKNSLKKLGLNSL